MSSTGVRDSDTTPKRLIRGLIENQTQFVQSLRVFANTSSLTGLGNPVGDSANAPVSPSSNSLQKNGDMWGGQHGSNFQITTIENGQIDVSKSTGVSFPMVVVNPEGGNDDFLDKMIPGSDVFLYQEQLIQTTNKPITIRPQLSLDITSVSGVGTVTAIVSDTSELSSGDKVDISGFTSNFDAGDVVITVTSGTTFTYLATGGGSENNGKLTRGNISTPGNVEVISDVNDITHFTFDTTTQLFKLDYSSVGIGGGGYDQIQNETTPLIQRSIMNFTGPGVTAEDNPGQNRTDVIIGGSEFTGPWTAPHDAGIQTLNDLRALEIVDINGDSRLLIAGVDGFGPDFIIPTGNKLRFVENITDLVEISASGIIMGVDKDINLNTSKLKSIGSAEFDNTVVFNPTTKNAIGFDNGNGFLIYNTEDTNKSHVFKAGGELLASITRIGSNQGGFSTHTISANVINPTERIFLNTNTIPGTPIDGNFWRNASGLFQFQQNGVTLGLGGGGSSNQIIDGDSSLTVTDGLGFQFNIDALSVGVISTTEWTIPKINMGGDIDMVNSDILNPANITLANGFNIQSLNSTSTVMAIPNGESLSILEGGENRISITNNIVLNCDLGGNIIFQEEGVEKFLYDGGNNNFVFQEDILLDAGSRIRSFDSDEIGLFVTNFTGSIGSLGSNQFPASLGSITPTIANFNSNFGAADGCHGSYITGSNANFAFRLSSTKWIVISVASDGTVSGLQVTS